jgi:hypothetical protein
MTTLHQLPNVSELLFGIRLSQKGSNFVEKGPEEKAFGPIVLIDRYLFRLRGSSSRHERRARSR